MFIMSRIFLEVVSSLIDDCRNRPFLIEKLYLIVILNHSEFKLHNHESQLK